MFRCIINHFRGIRKRNIEKKLYTLWGLSKPMAIQRFSRSFFYKYFLCDEGLLACHRQIVSHARHRHVMNYFRRMHLRKGSRKEIGDISARKLRIQRSKKGLFLCLYFISYNKVHFFEPEILPFSGKATIMPVHRIEILFPRREGWVHNLLLAMKHTKSHPLLIPQNSRQIKLVLVDLSTVSPHQSNNIRAIFT